MTATQQATIRDLLDKVIDLKESLAEKGAFGVDAAYYCGVAQSQLRGVTEAITDLAMSWGDERQRDEIAGNAEVER